MLCQLCSGLDLATIMQLMLEPDFYAVRYGKGDFCLDNVTDWSDFEASENICHFGIYGPGHASFKYEDYFVPYHKTLEDLYQASKNCDLCQALLQSASGMIKIRKAISDPSYWQKPSGEGLFLCGLGNGQGVQLMALDSFSTYAPLGGVGFCVDNG